MLFPEFVKDTGKIGVDLARDDAVVVIVIVVVVDELPNSVREDSEGTAEIVVLKVRKTTNRAERNAGAFGGNLTDPAQRNASRAGEWRKDAEPPKLVFTEGRLLE